MTVTTGCVRIKIFDFFLIDEHYAHKRMYADIAVTPGYRVLVLD
jgi:hypothetical protein